MRFYDFFGGCLRLIAGLLTYYVCCVSVVLLLSWFGFWFCLILVRWFLGTLYWCFDVVAFVITLFGYLTSFLGLGFPVGWLLPVGFAGHCIGA